LKASSPSSVFGLSGSGLPPGTSSSFKTPPLCSPTHHYCVDNSTSSQLLQQSTINKQELAPSFNKSAGKMNIYIKSGSKYINTTIGLKNHGKCASKCLYIIKTSQVNHHWPETCIGHPRKLQNFHRFTFPPLFPCLNLCIIRLQAGCDTSD